MRYWRILFIYFLSRLCLYFQWLESLQKFRIIGTCSLLDLGQENNINIFTQFLVHLPKLIMSKVDTFSTKKGLILKGNCLMLYTNFLNFSYLHVLKWEKKIINYYFWFISKLDSKRKFTLLEDINIQTCDYFKGMEFWRGG